MHITTSTVQDANETSDFGKYMQLPGQQLGLCAYQRIYINECELDIQFLATCTLSSLLGVLDI